jgi:4a-hydroxytetrahydrobiopterin dehydratase
MIRSVSSLSFRNTVLPSKSLISIISSKGVLSRVGVPLALQFRRSFSSPVVLYPGLSNTVTPPEQLTGTVRSKALASLPLWKAANNPEASSQTVILRDTLTRSFLFTDFITAWSFLSEIAIVAEKYNHHPEWSNVYNRVEITLTTHDAHGLSLKDIELASIIDLIAEKHLSTNKQ